MAAAPENLQSRLGHRFRDPDLLRRALVHRSMGEPRAETYERLEFLGDRVLGLIVAELLFETYPDEEEGALAKRFTALVRGETLARVAVALDLGAHVVLAPSEEDAGGRENPSILADACEAVIAALYIDGGLAAAQAFVRAHWTDLMAEDLSPPKDAKTALQEWAQGHGLALPKYTETARSGPAHAPEFEVSVSVQGLTPQGAVGPSKRAAEQAAAAALLDRIEGGKEGT
jgi:ribonuclease-3